MLQGFSFEVRHITGKDNPCDFPSRQPLPLALNTDEDMYLTDELNLCVHNIFASDRDLVLDPSEIRTEINKDKTLIKIINLLSSQKCPSSKDKDLQPYIRIWNELSLANDLILRGDRMIIPSKLQKKIVRIAHEGHLGIVKTKNLLR